MYLILNLRIYQTINKNLKSKFTFMENQNTLKKGYKTIFIIIAVISVVICAVFGYNFGKKKALEDNERDRLELPKK